MILKQLLKLCDSHIREAVQAGTPYCDFISGLLTLVKSNEWAKGYITPKTLSVVAKSSLPLSSVAVEVISVVESMDEKSIANVVVYQKVCAEIVRCYLRQNPANQSQAMVWVLKPSLVCKTPRQNCLSQALREALAAKPVVMAWVSELIQEFGAEPVSDNAILDLCKVQLLNACSTKDNWWAEGHVLYTFLKQHKYQLFSKASVSELLMALHACRTDKAFEDDLIETIEALDLKRIQYKPGFIRLCELMVENYLARNPVSYECAVRWVKEMEPARTSKKCGSDLVVIRMLEKSLETPNPDKQWLEILFKEIQDPRRLCNLSSCNMPAVIQLLAEDPDKKKFVWESPVTNYLIDSLLECEVVQPVADAAHLHKYCRTPAQAGAFIRLIIHSASVSGNHAVIDSMIIHLQAVGSLESTVSILDDFGRCADRSPVVVVGWLNATRKLFKSHESEWFKRYCQCLNLQEKSKDSDVAYTDLEQSVDDFCSRVKISPGNLSDQKLGLDELSVRVGFWCAKEERFLVLSRQLDEIGDLIQARAILSKYSTTKQITSDAVQVLSGME